MTITSWHNGLVDEVADEVISLLTEATKADGRAPVSERGLAALRRRGPAAVQVEQVRADVGGTEHFLVRESGGGLVGYAQLDTETDSEGRPVAELAVRPAARRGGVGTALVRALLERIGLPEQPAEPAADEPPVTPASLLVWSHSGHPAASRLARRFGFHTVRELRRMWVDLTEHPPGDVSAPSDVSIRPFQVGGDEAAVVEVNRRAFSWHPEQGGMSEADLVEKESETWFDPAGFLLAVDSDGGLLGFHWTKVHPPGAAAGDAVGEVYVVGVDPDAQGRGLGGLLTRAGLRHLADRGLRHTMLYVEADNPAAIRVYERLGFTHRDSDIQFGR
ncbi:mycothiol synthase [Actinoalloteichus hoggarensis]|uniref:mycothiol synthase n=1 Tax=Actinoalloteichus hoggarensis TaxID=1470176 RepID=UPI000B8AD341|nr:mycothiol synthase [Actinoalloteichus hoggarensis]MBB5922578.1 mycothiol synthase [Actinoalloteichus hoggarensis]